MGRDVLQFHAHNFLPHLVKSGYCGYNIIMKAVGVREFKNHLSYYLDMVHEKGTTISITKNSKPFAEIRPSNVDEEAHTLDEELAEREARGEIIRAERNAPVPRPPEDYIPIDWKKIYDETREDRFGY
jgi:prevent-host-death family protein